MTQRQNPPGDSVKIRALSSHSEYDAAVSLQHRIWGADVRETVPACLLQISQEVGGVAAGAFCSSGDLVGFVYGLTGVKDGELVHWSHLLAIHESWRDRGLGRELKQHQRELLLEIGVSVMYWTYDPLEARNAHLNLNKLGASVDRYVPHYYGEEPVAATDSVIGTDRFVVRWNLAESRTHPEDSPNPPSDVLDGVDGSVSDIQSLDLGSQAARTSHLPPVKVSVPPDIQELKKVDPSAAKEWRERTRSTFLDHLAVGYMVSGFVVDPNGGGGWYVLVPRDKAP